MSWCSVFTKVKTSVLILLLVFELIVVIRYSVDFEGKFYDALIIVQQFMQSIILFQICYFYTKKAAHFMEDAD